jgi:ssDNA-binding Zn-finger/Zn-ribbon topoisomerase 1
MTLEKIHQEEGTLTQAGLENTRQQLVLLENFVSDVLRKDQDYGIIPGTGSKPTLLKPGAANIIAAFNCHSEPTCENRTVMPDSDFVAYEYHVDVVHNGSGRVMARGFGECNSYETKYRYRELQKTCPHCGQSAIIKGREEYGGGWLCWKKKDGCGAKFEDSDAAIIDQPSGRVQNEDVMDQANTFMKMAIKRAEVDAALRLPGVARFFTQDLEDMQQKPSQAQEKDNEEPVTDAPPRPQKEPRKPRAAAAEGFTEADLQAWLKKEGIEWDDFVERLGLGTSWEDALAIGLTPAGAKVRWEKLSDINLSLIQPKVPHNI